MIYFENENYFYLLLIVPVLVAINFIGKRKLSKVRSKITNSKSANTLSTKSRSYLNFLSFSLLLLAFSTLIISLINPQVNNEKLVKPDLTKTEIVFVVDVSKSMLATDVIPNRLILAKSFMIDIVNQLNGEKVGIVIFAGKAISYMPLTSDYNFINSTTKSISNNLIVNQGTSLHEALKISSSFFNAKSNNVKILCVLSDGESHESAFIRLSDSIRKAGIKIFAFGLGTLKGSNIIDQDQDGNNVIKHDKNGKEIISVLHEENLFRITGSKTNQYNKVVDKEVSTGIFIKELRNIQDNTTSAIISKKGYFQLFLLISLCLLIIDIFIN
jgi:Ca-activated chloride channel family protein